MLTTVHRALIDTSGSALRWLISSLWILSIFKLFNQTWLSFSSHCLIIITRHGWICYLLISVMILPWILSIEFEIVHGLVLSAFILYLAEWLGNEVLVLLKSWKRIILILLWIDSIWRPICDCLKLTLHNLGRRLWINTLVLLIIRINRWHLTGYICIVSGGIRIYMLFESMDNVNLEILGYLIILSVTVEYTSISSLYIW